MSYFGNIYLQNVGGSPFVDQEVAIVETCNAGGTPCSMLISVIVLVIYPYNLKRKKHLRGFPCVTSEHVYADFVIIGVDLALKDRDYAIVLVTVVQPQLVVCKVLLSLRI